VKRIIRILSVLLVAAAPLVLTSSVFAASASMTLTPSSGTIAIGDTISIGVYENSGAQDVNAAKANLTYNANVLTFVSVTSSPAFSIDAATSGGNGTVNIERGALPAVTGNQLIATITFSGKASGSAAVNFTGSSSVLAASGPQANQNILTSTNGGNYTVPSPPSPPPPPPTPPPTPSPSPSPSPTPSPTPSPRPSSPSPSPSPSTKPSPSPSPSPRPSSSSSKDSTPPVISNINITDIGISSATVSWDTNEPATSQIDYGITTNYELTNGNGLYVQSHKLALSYKLLNPDTEFHVRVKSVDASGNVATAADQTFTTKAGNAILAVKVIDQKNNPVEGATVTIGSVHGKTDKKGTVTLEGLAPGQSTVLIDYSGQKTSKKVDIEVPTGAAQSVTLSILTSKNYLPIIIPSAIALLVLIAGAFFLRGGGSGGGALPFSGSNKVFGNVTGIDGSNGSGSGSTISPGGVVTPPPASSTPTNASKQKPKIKPGEEVNFDPTDNPPPPTIVRPTIPPRS
jgi:outer membrane biosynthesis protein TonB